MQVLQVLVAYKVCGVKPCGVKKSVLKGFEVVAVKVAAAAVVVDKKLTRILFANCPLTFSYMT